MMDIILIILEKVAYPVVGCVSLVCKMRSYVEFVKLVSFSIELINPKIVFVKQDSL